MTAALMWIAGCVLIGFTLRVGWGLAVIGWDLAGKLLP